MDELERLKQAIKEERAAPRQEAREAAVSAALSAFDANSERPRQGSQALNRLRNAAHAAIEILTGQRHMTSISTRPILSRAALASGASLIVLALAVTTAANWQAIEGFSRQDAREPVGVPPVQHPTNETASEAPSSLQPVSPTAKVEADQLEAAASLPQADAVSPPLWPPLRGATCRRSLKLRRHPRMPFATSAPWPAISPRRRPPAPSATLPPCRNRRRPPPITTRGATASRPSTPIRSR